MQLRNNNALSTVYHKGAVFCHERYLAHVNVLLFNVFYRFGGRLLIVNNQSHFHPQCTGVGGATQDAFINVKYGLTQFVTDVL